MKLALNCIFIAAGSILFMIRIKRSEVTINTSTLITKFGKLYPWGHYSGLCFLLILEGLINLRKTTQMKVAWCNMTTNSNFVIG